MSGYTYSCSDGNYYFVRWGNRHSCDCYTIKLYNYFESIAIGLIA